MQTIKSQIGPALPIMHRINHGFPCPLIRGDNDLNFLSASQKSRAQPECAIWLVEMGLDTLLIDK